MVGMLLNQREKTNLILLSSLLSIFDYFYFVRYMSDVHIGSIRAACIANSKDSTFLVTGGSDESIRYI